MARKAANPEDFWRNVINKIEGPFPEVGIGPPIPEVIKVEEEPKPDVPPALDLTQTGNFSRVTMELYFFLDGNTQKYFTMQNQNITDFGEMTLGKAVQIVRRRKKK